MRQGYNKLSWDYRGDDTPEDFESYALWVQILADRLLNGSPILDIGCGCGLPATKLFAESFDVTGVDFSEVQISRAKLLVPKAKFLCGDIMEMSFPAKSFAAIVSFYAIIHMPLKEQPALYQCIAEWLRPSGFFLATVGHDAWTGEDPAYLGIPGGRMCWSHAGEATNVTWIEDAGLNVHWTQFVPEGDSGHTLVLAQKPSI